MATATGRLSLCLTVQPRGTATTGRLRHAGDRARRMPERHTPNEPRMIMTKHRELGLFRQPRQQRLGAVHFDQLIEMHRRRHSEGACDLVQQRQPLLTTTFETGYPAARRQPWHFVRMDEEQDHHPQLGFVALPSERPPQPPLNRPRRR